MKSNLTVTEFIVQSEHLLCVVAVLKRIFTKIGINIETDSNARGKPANQVWAVMPAGGLYSPE